jgi:uncharacterized protein Usg
MRGEANPELVLNFGVTTANVIYRMPDHLELLQEFIWQKYDTAPEFPNLKKFLNFWVEEIEGPIHSVIVAHYKLVTPWNILMVDGKPDFRTH